jgi:hypothetical protein
MWRRACKGALSVVKVETEQRRGPGEVELRLHVTRQQLSGAAALGFGLDPVARGRRCDARSAPRYVLAGCPAYVIQCPFAGRG